MTNILIIDDEPLICEMLDLLLSAEGYDVVTAMDGREGVSKFSDRHIDVVVTDIIMPEGDGLEVIQEIKDRNPHVKIIAISGGSRIGHVNLLEMASKLGAIKVFSKPLDHAELLKAIKECVNQMQGSNVIKLR
ncbi:response regulator [Cohaesibacter gelatinilyticus]|uniref:Response regulator receiver domain-containing protein n=1 Tax=Cohaesibacter gelatinilyticus TaxID=372072 RepID=A0A285PM70_9HYPH|nr:response regulator [Cohaesibacter gelatinilyticus]SNZ21236.1 Response regulator receiver domain-containing protein [Cohaesibacter gelatinilyticus]